MAELRNAGEFVGRGERKAANYLKDRLPTGWTVICNKSLVSGETTREVDFIIVGEHAVFVVEEKSWSGQIRGDENGWFLDGGESFPSPINTAEQLARRLRGYLEGRIPRSPIPPIITSSLLVCFSPQKMPNRWSRTLAPGNRCSLSSAVRPISFQPTKSWLSIHWKASALDS
jgi:hypothetical protein